MHKFKFGMDRHRTTVRTPGVARPRSMDASLVFRVELRGGVQNRVRFIGDADECLVIVQASQVEHLPDAPCDYLASIAGLRAMPRAEVRAVPTDSPPVPDTPPVLDAPVPSFETAGSEDSPVVVPTAAALARIGTSAQVYTWMVSELLDIRLSEMVSTKPPRRVYRESATEAVEHVLLVTAARAAVASPGPWVEQWIECEHRYVARRCKLVPSLAAGDMARHAALGVRALARTLGMAPPDLGGSPSVADCHAAALRMLVAPGRQFAPVPPAADDHIRAVAAVLERRIHHVHATGPVSDTPDAPPDLRL